MKQYTVIWDDHWMQGSHMVHVAQKDWIETDDISTIMKSHYGENAQYIFEGFLCTLGEEIRPDEVVTLTNGE